MPVVLKMMNFEKDDKLSIQKECSKILKKWQELLKWMVATPPEEVVGLQQLEK